MNIFETLVSESDYDNYSPIIDSGSTPDLEEGENLFETLSKQTANDTFSFLETVKDVGQQIASKGTQGLLGAYGNIAETIGLNPDEKSLPGQKARQKAEFESGQFNGEDELLPEYAPLPTSKDVGKAIESITGVGEGKTPAGRIAGRGAQFVGEGLATPGGGAKGLISLGAAGVLGQSTREAGLPEGLASAVEIGTSVIPSAITGKLNPRSKEAKEIVDAGRAMGLTEKQITPLIQGNAKVATLNKVARKGEGTKKLFESIKESLGDSYANIKQSVKGSGKVNNANRQILETKFKNIRNEMSKTIKASPDKEAAIKFIDDAITKISKSGATPEELINFWQDINKSVKWNSIQGGKKSLTQLKEPIREVLHNVAPQAAKDFDMTNKLYSKYSQISKKLKPDVVDSFINKAELMSIPVASLALVQGNPWYLGTVASEAAVRTFAKEMLTNPYFQNISQKLVSNFNQGSLKGVKDLTNNVKSFMQNKYPEEDWSFLVEGTEPETK